MPAETTPPDDLPVPPEAVEPLIRGVRVLRELTEAGGTLSPSGLERATGLARSTVDRITSTLSRMGYVRLDGRDAVLTPRLMELGNAYLSALRLPGLLAARADALADELDESVSLAVADRDGIRFIHQATRRRAMSLSFRIGDLLPAERTAPGPLFASEWTPEQWLAWHERRAADPRDRAFRTVPPRELPFPDGEFEKAAARAGSDGWALDDQLIEPGLVAVSVPVREVRAGTVPGAVAGAGGREPFAATGRDPRTARIACVASVVSHTSRHTAADLRETLLPRLRATVAEMERALASAPEPAAGSAPSGLAAWTGASKNELGRDFVESLARGLTVLTAFGEGRSALTLTDVARATGLARATARRALITYEYLGLVAQTEGRFFTLTPRVLSLGFPPLARTSLPRIATPHLADLSKRLGETAALAVLAPGSTAEIHSTAEIQYTACAVSPRIMGVDIPVGTRLPARSTSAGEILLADRGTAGDYALVDEEWEEGLRALAVPVRDRAGRTVAALNVSLHAAGRTPGECVAEILPELRTTATRVTEEYRVASRFTKVPLL